MAISSPPRPSEVAAATDAHFEALIEEARRRARRRRAAIGGAGAAAALVVAGFAASMPRPVGSPSAPLAEVSQGAEPLRRASLGPSDQLVVSTHLHHSVTRHGDRWLFMYADGRLLQLTGRSGWDEQWLTAGGVALVRDTILASSLTDPDAAAAVPEVDAWNGGAYIQVRRDGQLLYAPRLRQAEWPGLRWGLSCITTDGGCARLHPAPAFDAVAERLATLRTWLPDEAWADKGIGAYQPDSYAISADVSIPNGRNPRRLPFEEDAVALLLPPAAGALLRAAPTFESVPPEADPAHADQAWAGGKRMTAADAKAIAVALSAAGFYRDSGTRRLWGDAAVAWDVGTLHFTSDLDGGRGLHVGIVPILPHGVAEGADYG